MIPDSVSASITVVIFWDILYLTKIVPGPEVCVQRQRQARTNRLRDEVIAERGAVSKQVVLPDA